MTEHEKRRKKLVAKPAKYIPLTEDKRLLKQLLKFADSMRERKKQLQNMPVRQLQFRDLEAMNELFYEVRPSDAIAFFADLMHDIAWQSIEEEREPLKACERLYMLHCFIRFIHCVSLA